MALKRPTVEDMLARRIPEGAELLYFRDDFDKGGPVVIAYREKNVPAEERAKNRKKIQDALDFVIRDTALREAAAKMNTNKEHYQST